MKIPILLATFLMCCFIATQTHASETNLVEAIKSTKPFVCEVISIELNETTDAPFLIVDRMPSDWKKENTGLQLSLGYIDQNILKIPGFGTFALKNRYYLDNSMDIDYSFSFENDRRVLSGGATVSVGKWFVIVEDPQLPSALKNGSSTAPSKKAIALRLWNQ
ncbi:MAG: hypothetical protein ACSHYA_19105 [Opitutaceae bacterium]